MASKGAIIFSALALALLRACSASPERIRIAYSAISGVQLPLWMAQEKGLFKRNGFEVDFLYIGCGAVVVQAMLGARNRAGVHGADLVMIANTVTTLVYSAIDNSLVRELEQEGSAAWN
jgi:ABC-type nitrate/sulfonate/bicarbonate transport system substrate-binding protein